MNQVTNGANGASPSADSPRRLVEIWAATAAAQLRAEQAKPGTLSGTEVSRLGDLVLSAAAWLTEDAAAAARAANERDRNARLAEFKVSPSYLAMNRFERVLAESRFR
jgi:hypothetical protein